MLQTPFLHHQHKQNTVVSLSKPPSRHGCQVNGSRRLWWVVPLPPLPDKWNINKRLSDCTQFDNTRNMFGSDYEQPEIANWRSTDPTFHPFGCYCEQASCIQEALISGDANLIVCHVSKRLQKLAHAINWANYFVTMVDSIGQIVLDTVHFWGTSDVRTSRVCLLTTTIPPSRSV
jgi:hypothetical protein